VRGPLSSHSEKYTLKEGSALAIIP
jgi:hypothetical protein